MHEHVVQLADAGVVLDRAEATEAKTVSDKQQTTADGTDGHRLNVSVLRVY